jgi:putative hemolysin
VGTVHAKDILAGVRSGTGETLQTILRPAVFVPGTREVEDVLADMRRQKIQLAIVLDEFGGTAGLVTMEDLLEEIVGQIYDEYDRTEPRPMTPGTETAPVLPGSMPIEEVNSAYGLALDDAAYTTLGGLLFGALGRLPKAGDRISLAGAEFEIVTMEGRRVGTVRLLTRAVPT